MKRGERTGWVERGEHACDSLPVGDAARSDLLRQTSLCGGVHWTLPAVVELARSERPASSLERHFAARQYALFLLVFALVLAACVFGFLLGRPSLAWGADYRCVEADLMAQVETDGSIAVTDQRVFDFSGDGAKSETLTWLYNGFSEDAEISIKHVRMAELDEEGNVSGSWVSLKSTTFLLSWRGGGRPESDAWSYDAFQNKLYAFVRDLPDRAVFEVIYEVADAVEAYDDAADFQWAYAPQDYAVDMHNVQAAVVLPMPADAIVKPGDNVRAWGHGPADGVVDIKLDGAVTFADELVAASAFAEARVLFPVEWLTNLSDADRAEHQGSLQYYWTTRYEESWVDRESHQKILHDGLALGALGVSAALLLVALLAYARFGRERPPAFTDDYWCDVPEPGMEPAVLGRLWRWNHESPDDVVATVLDMVRRGALHVRCDKNGRPSALEIPREGEPPSAPLDAATLVLLNALAQDAESVSLRELSATAHERPGDFLRAVRTWQDALSVHADPERFFDAGSRKAQRVALVLAALLVVVAVATLIFVDWQVGLLVLLAAAAVGVLANYTMRRTPHGNEIAAHAKALRNWMRDGGWEAQIGELTDAERAELVPYGHLFGVLKFLKGTPDAATVQLIALAPKLSQALDDALRVAHHHAEV